MLENHHCSSGFQLLLKFDLLKGLTPDELRRFRKVVVDIILATDLTYHVEFVSKMQVSTAQLKIATFWLKFDLFRMH